LCMLTRLGVLLLLLAVSSLSQVQAADMIAWSRGPSSTTSSQQVFDFDLAVRPSSAVTISGGSAAFSVEIKTKAGIPELVTLLAVGLPQSWNASFDPESGLPQPVFSSTLTIATSLSTPVGVYNFTIQATSKQLIRTVPTALILMLAPADFVISLSPESRSVVQGGSTTYIVTITSIGAFSQPVLLSAVGLPVGANGRLEPRTFHPRPGQMAQASTLYVSTNSTATPGEYEIWVAATSGTATRAAKSTLVVLYSDPFRQAWQILSNLPDTMKVGIIGSAIGAASAIIVATIYVHWGRGKKDRNANG